MKNYPSDVSTARIKNKAVKGAGINLFTQAIGYICHMAGVIILARLLKPEDFGLVTMVATFSLWIRNFGYNGFSEYIIQKQRISHQEINSIFWLHVFMATLLAICFYFFGYFLVYFYEEPALLHLSAAMATAFIFQALFTSHFAVLQREMKFISIAFINLGALILSFVVAIGGAVQGIGYWAVASRQIVIPAITAVAAWTICRWRPGFPRNLRDASAGLKYSIQVYSNFSLGYITRNIDKVLLGKFHGSELLGNYDRAYHLSTMPAEQVLTPLHPVMLATLSRLRDNTVEFKQFYINALSIVAFFATMGASILTLTGKDLILLLLGPEWSLAGTVLTALGPGIAAMLVYGTHSWLHLSLGRPDKWLRWNIFVTVATVIAFTIAAPIGAVAVAITYSVRAYLIVLPSIWYAGRPIKLDLRNIILAIWPYYLAAILVCIIWHIISNQWLILIMFLNNVSILPKIIITALYAMFLNIILVITFQGSLKSVRDTSKLIKILFQKENK